MSGVFKRKHEPTGIEFLDNAVEIDIEVWKFCKNEKNIPKRCWFSHGVPLVRLARSLVIKATAANSIYPSNDHEVERRRDAMQDAIGINEGIFQAIQMVIWEMESVDCNKLDRIGTMLKNESNLLRGQKTKCKVLESKDEKQA